MADFKLRWLRSGLIALGLLVRLPGAEALKPEELCTEFMHQLQEANPSATLEKVDDLEVRLTDEKGGKRTYLLSNCRKLVAADPDHAGEIIGNFIKAYDAGPAETPEAILPVVKAAGWIEELKAASRPGAAAEGPGLAFEQLNEDLIIVYALESVRGLSYLTPERLGKILPDSSGVRELATQNLERMILPKVTQRGSNGFFMIQAGEIFGTSLLLLDRLWVAEKISVKGAYVVGLPTRDILVITGSEEKEGLKRAREFVDKALAREPPHRITGDLFVRRDGRWEKWTE